MKNNIYRLLFVIVFIFVFVCSANAQNLPRTITNRHTLADWVRNGTFTLTNKTFTSPTITSPTISGTISFTMENGELLLNETDSEVEFRADDDATTLMRFIMASSVDSPNVADNDLFEIVCEANDDSSTLTQWVKLYMKILDASDESEDSEFSILTFLAGTQYTSAKWAGNVYTQYADAAAYFTITQANGGGVTFDGTSDGTASFTFSDIIYGGADGSGVDVVFYSGTDGDNMTWDASEEALLITGTDNQDALDIVDGDLNVTDNVQVNGNFCFLADTSSANDSYGGTMDPPKTAWVTGTIILWTAGLANTGACTIAPDGLAAKNIKTASGADPANNDILTTSVSMGVYDGTNVVLLNPATTCD